MKVKVNATIFTYLTVFKYFNFIERGNPYILIDFIKTNYILVKFGKFQRFKLITPLQKSV